MDSGTSLKDVITKIREMKTEKLSLSFTRKSRSGYTSFSPNISASVLDDIWTLIDDYIAKMQNMDVIEYSPTAHQDETIEHCTTDSVKNYVDVLEGIRASEFTETEINPDNITFYCLQMLGKSEADNVYFFRRVTRFKRLSTSGFWGLFQGKNFNRLDSKVLGIDGCVDVLCYHNHIFVFNHIALERIFDMKDQFSEMAEAALEKIRDLGRIDNINTFVDDCQDDKRIQRTLAKMLQEHDDFGRAFQDFEAVKHTIEIFELDIEINDKKQIVYRDKGQIIDILRFIRDSYYESILQKRNGIDDGT